MALYRLESDPQLSSPIIVAALEGWVDAGSAGTAAAEQLAADGELVATFDADGIYDYRARRPTLDIVDGRPMELRWPALTLRAITMEGRELLVLTGPEPDYRWQELSDDLVTLARRLGATGWASLGAIPAAVPHTRPVPILATASAAGLLPAGIRQGPDGLLRVPAAALSVFERAMGMSGVPSIGLFAQVPHYVNATYPTASIALLTALGRFLGVELPVGPLATSALERRTMLDAAAANDDETRAHVERLELLADQSALPEGDELIADIERFLRQGGEDDEGGGGDGGPRLH